MDATQGAVRVCLITPFSTADELKPIPRGTVATLRNRLRREADFWRWRAGYGKFHFSTYADRGNSNRGDIAIRRAAQQLLRGALGSVAFSDLGWNEVGRAGAGWIRDNVDLLVICGSGYFHFDRAGGLAPRVARDVQVMRALHCPIVSLSPGVNRPLGPDGAVSDAITPAARETLRAVLDLLALSSARDEDSRRLLEEVAPGRTVTLPDAALFLEPAPPPPGLPPRGEALNVGLNLAFHGTHSSPVMPQRLAVVAEAARTLAARRPCRFFYFVHSDSERVLPRLLHASGVAVQAVDTGPEEMLAWYRAMDMHLCQMLHSSILSLNAGVPTVNLSYDVKNAAFFRLMGIEALCLPGGTTTAAALAATLGDVADRRAPIAAAVVARKAVLRAEMDRYLQRIAALVRHPAERAAVAS